MQPCPKCGSNKTVRGIYYDRLTGGGPQFFRPDHLKLITLHSPDVRPQEQVFNACLKCGHLWNQLDPQKLREIVTKCCTDELKNELLKDE